MRRSQGIELALVLICLIAYMGYHLWIFVVRPLLNAKRKNRSRRISVSQASHDVRTAWTYYSASDKADSGVPAVQTLRNSIMAASFMATTCGLMATSGVLQVLTDEQRLGQLRKLGDLDPAVTLAGSEGLVRVEWKMAIALLMLLLALLLFVQSIRLYSFLAYYIRMQAMDTRSRSAATMAVTLGLSRRSGLCWTAGVRTFYAFIPVQLWVMGPIALVVTTAAVLIILAITDEVDGSRDYSDFTRGRSASAAEEEVKLQVPSEQQGGNLTTTCSDGRTAPLAEHL